MKRLSVSLLSVLILVATGALSHGSPVRDIYPDTWVANDALGRAMPTYKEVGPVKHDHRRVVSIFYITWHSDARATDMKSPYSADVSKILAQDPKARLDANNPLWKDGSYHWGEPETGYFLSKDEYIIRKDMSMLSDAGVDVLVMDVTNAVRYWDEWDVLFPVMEKMKAEGNKVPKFCFWAFNGPCITVVQDLYEKIYKEGKYKDLWYEWDGKPLLLCSGTPLMNGGGGPIENPNPHYDASAKTDKNNPHYGDPDFTEEFYKDYTKDVKSFFTLRNMWWGYYEWCGKRFVGTEDNWSFGYQLNDDKVKAMKPEELASTHHGKREQYAVTPAQHPVSMVGKSWTREKGEPELNDQDLPVTTYIPWLGKTVDHPEGYGAYFQERWDEALKSDVQFIYLNDWDEWTAGKYPPDPGQNVNFMRRDKSSFYFVDQYNSEFNRTIQPMKGGYTDNYYMQMAQNIRRYKGIRPIPVNHGYRKIDMDKDFSSWSKVKVEYLDTIGDSAHRDYNGYGGLHYKDETGRNDIVKSKVAVDRDKVYFYVETNEALTPHTDKNWMLLLIDADKNPNTGWYGYDYSLNLKVVDDHTTTLMRYVGDSWKEVAPVNYKHKDKQLEIAVPRTLLGLTGNSLTFDFKWSDNPTDLKDPISLCTAGDTAPNRRFNYRFIWEK